MIIWSYPQWNTSRKWTCKNSKKKKKNTLLVAVTLDIKRGRKRTRPKKRGIMKSISIQSVSSHW